MTPSLESELLSTGTRQLRGRVDTPPRAGRAVS
jgi:hypothetical protein